MTDMPQEDMDRAQQARERERDVLEREQRGKGYGEDEGEREGALPEAGSDGGGAPGAAGADEQE